MKNSDVVCNVCSFFCIRNVNRKLLHLNYYKIQIFIYCINLEKIAKPIIFNKSYSQFLQTLILIKVVYPLHHYNLYNKKVEISFIHDFRFYFIANLC